MNGDNVIKEARITYPWELSDANACNQRISIFIIID